MKNIFKPGDKKQTGYLIKETDVASFQGNVVHSVISTFTLAREIEWSTRQFVLDIREDDEEGIGTFINIDHKGPAFVGEELTFTASYYSLNGNELTCTFEVTIGDRLIADGKTGQKILKREKIKKIFTRSK